MPKPALLAALLALAATGCGPEWQVRAEPDLWRIDPHETRRLRDVRIDPHYQPRLTDPNHWRVYTTLSEPQALTDGDTTTLARGPEQTNPSQWILIDLGAVCCFQGVRQLHPAGAGEPACYRIDTAGDHGFPFTLQYVGTGEPAVSAATFPRAVHARFLRITLVTEPAEPWSISELELF